MDTLWYGKHYDLSMFGAVGHKGWRMIASAIVDPFSGILKIGN